MNLVRTKSGTTIHKPDCWHLGARTNARPVPWDWAKDKTRDQVLHVVLEFGYHCCATCKPLGDW